MLRFLNNFIKTSTLVNNSVVFNGLNRFSTRKDMSATLNDEGQRLVWLDLELTGLEDHGRIMEIGCLVTDLNLKPIGEGVNIIIHQSDDILNTMNSWCKDTHGRSGLTDECRQSKISLEEAESTVLEYLKKHTIEGKCPMAGNTIHEDRRFLLKFMPKLINHLHYRIVDVSSIKELSRRWYPDEYKRCPKKRFEHRCLSDVHESIDELAYYRKNVFKQ